MGDEESEVAPDPGESNSGGNSSLTVVNGRPFPCDSDVSWGAAKIFWRNSDYVEVMVS